VLLLCDLKMEAVGGALPKVLEVDSVDLSAMELEVLKLLGILQQVK